MSFALATRTSHNREMLVLTSIGETKRPKLSNGVQEGIIFSITLFNDVMAQLLKRLSSTVKVSLYTDDICMSVSDRNWDHLQNGLQCAVQVTEHFLNEPVIDIAPAKIGSSCMHT